MSIGHSVFVNSFHYLKYAGVSDIRFSVTELYSKAGTLLVDY